MNRTSVHSLSVATLCNIVIPSGELLLIRNRGNFRRGRGTTYGPIGGGVAVPTDVMQQILNSMSDNSPVCERKPHDDGIIDVRVSLGSPIMGEGQVEAFRRMAHDMLKLIPPEYLSPLAELQEELIDEEAILPMGALDDVVIGEPGDPLMYIGDNRNDPGKDRLYVSVFSPVQLSTDVLKAILPHALGEDSVLRLVDPAKIEDGTRSGLLTEAVRLLAGQR